MKDSIPNLSPIFQPNGQTLEGSFSAVSKQNFATKYSFFSIFRDLQDFQSFAPIEAEIFRKNLQKISHFFFPKFCKNRDFSTLFIEFCTDSDENFSEFRRILKEMLRVLDISEFLMKSSRISRILTENFPNYDDSKIRMIRSPMNRILHPCIAQPCPEGVQEVIPHEERGHVDVRRVGEV